MKIRIASLLVALLFACSSNDSPREVASHFLKAFQVHDFEKASEYSTVETAKMLKQLERIEEVENRQSYLASGEITVVSEEISGNNAIVFFKENGSDDEEKLRLKKVTIDGEKEWRVSLSKTDVKIPVEPGSSIPDTTLLQVF